MLQASGVAEDHAVDIASSIAAAMRRMGIAGLPRNYALFYALFTGEDAALRGAFEALGERPTQAALDRLAAEHLAAGEPHALVETARDEIARRAHDILALVGREHSSLEKFGLVLDRTSDGLERRADISRDLLRRVVGIMATATETTLAQSRQISRAMQDKSDELEKMRADLARCKELAETDPLTGVWNRRAFDRRIAAVFDDRRAVMFHALILADIDGFKAFNDRYGHPAGDRVLRMVAELLRIQGGDAGFLARTGGEEFALILEGLSQAAVEEVAEAMRRAVEKAAFGPDRPQRADRASRGHVPLTVSLGVCMAADADGAEDLYAKADSALYAAKNEGRNRVSVHARPPRGAFVKDWRLYRDG